MSDCDTLALIQRSAERWAKERGRHWSTQFQPQTDEHVFDRLMRDIDEQGWLPEVLDNWGNHPILTVAELGRVIATELPAAFLPVLAHNLGVQLLARGDRARTALQSRPIAASPYADRSRTSSAVLATPVGDGWLLDGELTWVVNAIAGHSCAVPARLASGVTGLFDVNLVPPGCSLSQSHPLMGLWGVPVRRVGFSSFRVSSEALIATERAADELLRDGYRMIRWGALGMLLGIFERFTSEATAYATIRVQGGRKIIDHVPVRRLLDAMAACTDSLAQWLHRLKSGSDSRELDYTSADVRRHVLQASDCGLQVFGGSGYVCPGLPERCWRDVRQVVSLCG